MGQPIPSLHGPSENQVPNWTQYLPDHLPRGTYYMAVTAMDAQGHESAYSNEIKMWVP